MNYMFFSSFPAVFWIVVSILFGHLLGKIKIGRVRFGSAAVLFFSMFLGHALSAMYTYINTNTSMIIQEMKTISDLGTVLFLSVIGLIAGKEIVSANKKKKEYLYFFLGTVMVGSGFLSYKLILSMIPSLDKSLMIGLLCGALTSTPGMSAAQECTYLNADRITIGYGSAYLFGVLFAVFAAQIIDKKTSVATDATDGIGCLQNLCEKKGTDSTFFLILVSVVGGYVLGKLPIPGTKDSLGVSFGVLVSSIICGVLTPNIVIIVHFWTGYF